MNPMHTAKEEEKERYVVCVFIERETRGMSLHYASAPFRLYSFARIRVGHKRSPGSLYRGGGSSQVIRAFTSTPPLHTSNGIYGHFFFLLLSYL